MLASEIQAAEAYRAAIHESRRLAKFYREHTFSERDEEKLLRMIDAASAKRDAAEKVFRKMLEDSSE